MRRRYTAPTPAARCLLAPPAGRNLQAHPTPPTPVTDSERRARLRAAAVEGKAALSKLQDLLDASEAHLAGERTQLADAERRGAMAERIGDAETLQVAQEFAAKHRERVRVLERKVEAQRAEIQLLERDVEQVVRELKQAGFGVDPVPDPGPDEGDVRLASELDRKRREADADALLANLKKKMGR